ncbi:unnamed protein product [Urochloa decumbens]|uniref:Fe2OG dioxygenase domain-containing protein n=1 Tax=Urochloa decumbens TaxID=240449 RepID=A0ABC9F6A8_9POAL
MAVSGALPVVDLAPFLTGGDDGGIASVTEAVREACRTHGFFRAVNHGRPSQPAGYGRQPAHSADKNEYPAEPAGLRETVEECHGKLTELGLLIQGILNECMGLPPGSLSDYNNDRSFDHMTAKRYFPATAEDENIGFSEHEDGNCVTFIFQDSVGGLEVLRDGHWVPAEPVDGTRQHHRQHRRCHAVLSNSKLKSATHRVVRKPAHRHSFAFFFNLHCDKWVEPLPEFTPKIGEAPRYRRFLYREYQQLRVRNKTHPPERPEDVIRITHYAI